MNRPAFYSFLLAALAMVCATALVMTGHQAPDAFYLVASAGAGAGAMAAAPRGPT